MADFRSELTRFLTSNQVPDLWAYLLVSPDAPDMAVEERLRERRRWAESHTADSLYGMDAVFLLLHETEVRRELARTRRAAQRREAGDRGQASPLPAAPTPPPPPPSALASAQDALPGSDPSDFEDETPTRLGPANQGPARVTLPRPSPEDEEVTAIRPTPALSVSVPVSVPVPPPRAPVPAGVRLAAPRPPAPTPAGVAVRPRPPTPPARGPSGNDATLNRPLRGLPTDMSDPPTNPGRTPNGAPPPAGSPFRPVAEAIPGVTVTPAVAPGTASPRPTLPAPVPPPAREVPPTMAPRAPDPPAAREVTARVSLPPSTRQHLPLAPLAVVGRLGAAFVSLVLAVGLTWLTFHVKPPGFGGVPMEPPGQDE